MRFPHFGLGRALKEIAQALDPSGSFDSPRLREIRVRTPQQALARDWEKVAHTWDRPAGWYATAHAE